MFFKLIRKNWFWIIYLMTGYSIPLSGYAQGENTFVIDDDDKSITAINQIIAETEVAALENTEIEVIQAEATAAKQYQQAAEQNSATESSPLYIINY
jgi:hypothetical protein